MISNSLLRELQPTRQRLIFWEQFEREFVGARDVSGITAQRNPAKRAAPFAKQRPNIFENEPGNIERVFHSGFFCLGANVIAIIERNGAFLLQCEHCLDVHAHGVHCSLNIFFRIFPAQNERIFERHPVRNIAVQRVVSTGLIRENVGHDPALNDLRENIRAIADESHGKRFSISARFVGQFERVIERMQRRRDQAGVFIVSSRCHFALQRCRELPQLQCAAARPQPRAASDFQDRFHSLAVPAGARPAMSRLLATCC